MRIHRRKHLWGNAKHAPQGMGRGNWQGEGFGERKAHPTRFNELATELCEKKNPRFYQRTTRGLQTALGLDAGTFHRYRTGLSNAPSVVIAHMEALLNPEQMRLPSKQFWQYIDHFSVKSIMRKMEDSNQMELVFEIHFENSVFHVRPFAIYQIRKFRQVLFEHTGIIAFPVAPRIWKYIVDSAIESDYRGVLAVESETNEDETTYAMTA